MKRQTFLSCILLSLLAITGTACDSDGGTTGEGNAATTDTTTAGTAGDTTTAADDAAATTDDATAATDDAGPAEEATPWGAECSVDADCGEPTDYCVVQPGAEFGYCTIACPNGGSDCTYDDWTCNIIGTCDAPAATWCGPPEEIPNSDGFLIACP